MRNTHKTIAESLVTLQEILEIADKTNKEVVTYISMGFGNPYGDAWNVEIVGEWTEKLANMGVKILSLSDTVGSSTPEVIDYLFSNLIPKYPNVEFGAHLHTTPDKWFEKIDAAYNAGCRRYDGAIQGFGGCPMAKDDLTGNMPTEKLLSYFTTKKENTNTSPMSFESAYNEATKLFGEFHQKQFPAIHYKILATILFLQAPKRASQVAFLAQQKIEFFTKMLSIPIWAITTVLCSYFS